MALDYGGRWGQVLAIVLGAVVGVMAYLGVREFVIGIGPGGLANVAGVAVIGILLGTVFLAISRGVGRGLVETFTQYVGVWHILWTVAYLVIDVWMAGMDTETVSWSVAVLLVIVGLILTAAVQSAISDSVREYVPGRGRY